MKEQNNKKDYNLTVEELYQKLNTNINGLSEEEFKENVEKLKIQIDEEIKKVKNNSSFVEEATKNKRKLSREIIIEDMIKNVELDNYEIIINRKEAIKKGINLLKDEDILLILGKGSEEYQIIGNDEFTHNDYKEAIKNIKR